MHVVVSGAAGFIGSHTTERLIAAVTASPASTRSTSTLPADRKRQNAEALATLPGFRLVTGNICDAASVADAITADVDVVCHLAALAGVRPSLAEPLRYLTPNIGAQA